ncbi:armadillo-type protein [Choanephora cucurbitarum]|nr:armadillo-type protein [Choanephora cucurbitarum]
MSVSIEELKLKLSGIEGIQDDVVVSCVERLNQLILQQEKTWELGTTSCQSLADALRTPSLRTPLGEAGLIKSLSVLLESASGNQADFQIQALRVLGNLCFDHESNRKHVKDAGIITTAASYLGSGRADLVRTVCGFYLNSSMDYVPIQHEIAESGAAKKLIELIQPGAEDDGTITMAIKVLDNLVPEETARKIIADPSTVRTYVTMIQHLYTSGDYVDELDNLENLADTLLQLILDDDQLENEIVEMGSLDVLLDFLENANLDEEEQEEKEKLEDIRKTMSKVIICATSTDSKMESLYNNQQLLSKLLAMAKNESEPVHQCAVYILGNLARTDEHCIELVEKYQLSKLLLDLYQKTENATFQYAILGCLKHLCLPVPNKTVIGNDDCIQIVSSMLSESKDMLKRNQFLTIGIIKLLCAGNFENCKRVVEQDVLLLVTFFIKRVDDVAAKSEATRILTNLVKTIWVHQNNATLKTKMMNAHIVDPIMELVRTSTFPILKNDGVMALILIFSDAELTSVWKEALPLANAEPTIQLPTNQEGDNSDEKPESRSFLQVLVDDICSETSEVPVQIQCNMCLLLVKLVEAAKQVQHQQDFILDIKNSSDKFAQIQESSELYKYTDTLLKALE